MTKFACIFQIYWCLFELLKTVTKSFKKFWQLAIESDWCNCVLLLSSSQSLEFGIWSVGSLSESWSTPEVVPRIVVHWLERLLGTTDYSPLNTIVTPVKKNFAMPDAASLESSEVAWNPPNPHYKSIPYAQPRLGLAEVSQPRFGICSVYIQELHIQSVNRRSIGE